MSHSGKGFTDRKFRLGAISDHRMSGSRIPHDATIAVGDDTEHRYTPIRSSHDVGRFHLITVSGGRGTPKTYNPTMETHGTIYRPIHPSMTPEDIEGATYARDDGTFWTFHHSSPEEHHDFATEVEGLSLHLFQPAINDALVRLASASGRSAIRKAKAKAEALATFSRAIATKAHLDVIGHTLGHFGRDPHKDHKRTIIRGAVVSTMDRWEKGDEAAQARRTIVLADANRLIATLAKTHTIQTWPAKRAADAEKAKKEAEAMQTQTETPANGDDA